MLQPGSTLRSVTIPSVSSVNCGVVSPPDPRRPASSSASRVRSAPRPDSVKRSRETFARPVPARARR